MMNSGVRSSGLHPAGYELRNRIGRRTAGLLLAALVSAAVSTAQADVTLRLATENFPPYSMTLDGSAHARSGEEITGFAAEIVKELMRRADVPSTFELVPWKRAYESALSEANHGVFSTTRTEQRESLFHWVGPIAENNWVFMGAADSDITLERLEDAGNYRIGGYLEDAIASYLEGQGLDVDYVANDVLNVRKLAKGRIDLWPVVQLKGPQLARQEGVSVKEIFVIKRTEMALALNLDTDPRIVERLQATLDEMHTDGTVERITTAFIERGY